MTNPVLKKTIFISLIGHITVFSIFSFSFGDRIPKAEYVSVSFWGQFLRNSQVAQPITRGGVPLNNFNRQLPTKKIDTSVIEKKADDFTLASNYYFKPPISLTSNTEKEIFLTKTPTPLLSRKRREPVIIFHPLLPYSFSLYFKDRQVAHVELMFKIISSGAKNSIVIKRKISSGNLEVDLLSARYIGHYLFIRQNSFPPNNWQIVKIDLSAEND